MELRWSKLNYFFRRVNLIITSYVEFPVIYKDLFFIFFILLGQINLSRDLNCQTRCETE